MSATPVHPEAHAVRKARINSDIVKLCASPRPLWTHPSAQGIGLFTHVAGTKTVPRNPHLSFGDQVDKEVALLPLGGPKKIAPSKTREAPDEELAALYRELQDAVVAEETIYNDQRAAAEERGEAPKDAYRMSLDTLKKKYGGVNDPPPEMSIPSTSREKRRHSDLASSENDSTAKRKSRVTFAPEVESRRQSISSMSSASRETDGERRGSGSKPSNSSDHNPWRDPRRQGR